MNILYEDRDIIVCEKPVGTASQNERGFEVDMVSLLMQHVKRQGVKTPYIAVVHRLDKMVGGVMVYAKTRRAAVELSGQVSGGQMTKKYYAVVCGELKEEEGTLVDYIVKDGKTNTSSVASPEQKGAKKAVLNYKKIAEKKIATPEGDGFICTLLEIELLTGRHHQIRVQFSSRGLPLIGDRKYNQNRQKTVKDIGIGLYAYNLEFYHPVTGEQLKFQRLPFRGVFADFSEYFEQCADGS